MDDQDPIFEQIADGLAETGYAIVDDFLDAGTAEGLLDSLLLGKAEGAFKKAGIGKQADLQIKEDIRGDYISWIDGQTKNPFQRAYIDKVSEMMVYLNRSLYLGLKDFEIHFAFYPEGTFYKKHSDRFKQTDQRVISVVLYLNDQWSEAKGGQLVLYPEGKEEVRITPKLGRLACFRSEIVHEVLPATATRFSVTGWLLNKPIGVRF